MTDLIRKHPEDITLSNPPLTEAWLELRWALRSIDPPLIMKDPHFDSAWVNFYSRIHSRFPTLESVNSELPDQVVPYQIRYRFRPEERKWPVLQIGPGVATLNYVDDYDWKVFSKDALYLRSHLIQAYGSSNLKFTHIFLRYRNIEPFNPLTNDVREFLRDKLNLHFDLPTPKGVGDDKVLPYPLEIRTEFRINEPKVTAALHLATAERRNIDQKSKEHVVLWELTVSSRTPSVPQIKNAAKFSNWLDDAHGIVHEWFFSLIDGQLWEKYK